MKLYFFWTAWTSNEPDCKMSFSWIKWCNSLDPDCKNRLGKQNIYRSQVYLCTDIKIKCSKMMWNCVYCKNPLNPLPLFQQASGRQIKKCNNKKCKIEVKRCTSAWHLSSTATSSDWALKCSKLKWFKMSKAEHCGGSESCSGCCKLFIGRMSWWGSWAREL